MKDCVVSLHLDEVNKYKKTVVANDSQLGYYLKNCWGFDLYRDNSLIPRETIKMAALGALIERARSYDDIANEVRSFISRIVGPSLELMGTSIELLKLEGLIETVNDNDKGDSSLLQLSPTGLQELKAYLRSNRKSGGAELNKLVIALKLRFIDILDDDERRDQLLAIRDMYHNEKRRLEDLKNQTTWLTGFLLESIELDLFLVNKKIEWCDQRIRIQT